MSDILAAARRAERDAFAAIGALGERELGAVEAWVASGCEGPQPRPDSEARRVLADRLNASIAAREAAERTAGGKVETTGADVRIQGEIAATDCGCAGVRTA